MARVQGTWGNGGITTSPIRLWSQSNYGEDLVFGYRGGPLCYWAASTGVSTRGNIINLTNYPASDGVPTIANIASVSDIFRFAFCFGTNVIDSAVQDPMLIRWSDQENVFNWNPLTGNLTAGSLRVCLLYTSPSPRDGLLSRMPSSA